MKTRFLLFGLTLLLLTGCVCAGAETLVLPDDTLVIEEAAFLNCVSLAGPLTIPDGVTAIGPSAFAGCSGLSGTPVIPPSVAVIGAHAFDGCSGLSGTLYLPETVTVDDTAFDNCPHLTVIRGEAPAMQVALILDGPLEDGSMISECYNAASAYCAAHGYPFTAVDAAEGLQDAVAAGCSVVLAPGFSYAEALAESAAEDPDVKFIGLDMSEDDLGAEIPGNVFLASYKEEQAGFMAGYAAVRLGYRHLGFIGGMETPSVNSYGYGFVQGADAAAAELNAAGAVCVEFSYANAFWPSDTLARRMKTWYAQGVEIVFSCGGGISGSVAAAAAQFDGARIIGVDTDQAADLGADRTVTSATKSLSATVPYVLDAISGGQWESMGGTARRLGVVSGSPEENFVRLAPSTQYAEGFTLQDYGALLNAILNGEYSVSGASGGMPSAGIHVCLLTPAERSIAMVTGSRTQSDEERGTALALQRQYGIEAVQLATYPENFYEESEVTSQIIESFAEDPTVRAIIVCQAVPGTAEGFRRVKEARSDVLCLAGVPEEPLDLIGARADLTVTTDPVARGYLMIKAAKDLGCGTFVHLSFERHLNIDGIALRLAVMEEAGRDLGVAVVRQNVKDPVGEEGYEAALDDVAEIVPALLQEYGQNTAFFCTNDGQTVALISKLLDLGGYFIEADVPSPLLGYPQALNLNLDGMDYAAALTAVENAIVARGRSGHFGTWAYPYSRTLLQALFRHAMNVLDGESSVAGIGDLCGALEAYSPGAQWNGSYESDTVIMVYQDTYIMGAPGRYMGNTGVEIPAKYYNID